MCARVSRFRRACRKQFDEWQAREKRWRDNRRLFGNYVTYKGAVPYVKRARPSWIETYCEPNRLAASEICDAYADYLQHGRSTRDRKPLSS